MVGSDRFRSAWNRWWTGTLLLSTPSVGDYNRILSATAGSFPDRNLFLSAVRRNDNLSPIDRRTPSLRWLSNGAFTEAVFDVGEKYDLNFSLSQFLRRG
jgi:hypothetical protein